MTFATQSPQSPRGAWWKQLSDHIHARTGQQLRRLQIYFSGGRIVIRGKVPCEDVRRCAEEAAREVVPEKFLAVMLSIDEEVKNGATAAPQAAPAAKSRLTEPPDPLDLLVYRRMYDLVAGN
jgi:hypothetical protein